MIKKLVLRNFRNHEKAEIPFYEGIHLIQGKNGAGKTSILEAIYLLSTGRSFRTAHLTDLIRKGSSHFYIEAHFNKDGVEQVLSLGFDGTNRKIHYNKTTFPNLSHVLGILPSVLFAPKDSALIIGSPAERRRFLNIQLAQIDPLYVHHLMRYHKAMKHRNALLKKRIEETIESWEQMMALSAAYLMEKRESLIEKLRPKVNRYAQGLSHNEDAFDLTYTPSISMKRKDFLLTVYQKQRPKELILGSTILGPHRDDFMITFNEREAKVYASEGQKRTCTTALKMAEWDELAEQSGCSPILSIDDFGVHLDESRIALLHEKLNSFGQVFLTTPLEIDLNAKCYFVEKGQVKETVNPKS